jgi:hexulose-6-phosphate isomerase
MMKAAFSMFSFSDDEKPEEIFPLIRQAGYDGAELVLSAKGYLTCNSDDDEIRTLRKAAEAQGLSIPSLGASCLWDYNLVSENRETREKAKAIIRFQLHAAGLLGADTVLVIPGYVGSDFIPGTETVRYDIAWERAGEALLELGRYAGREGVHIGIENVWNRFLLSPLEAVRFIDEIGSPDVGFYLDVGNILYIGFPEHWIAILGKRIFKIHLSDYRKGQAGLGAFVDLFAGDVDFKAVAAALKAAGYDDWLTLEMLPNYKQFPRTSIFSNKYAVDAIIQMCVL